MFIIQNASKHFDHVFRKTKNIRFTIDFEMSALTDHILRCQVPLTLAFTIGRMC